jgi:hypothetical protein
MIPLELVRDMLPRVFSSVMQRPCTALLDHVLFMVLVSHARMGRLSLAFPQTGHDYTRPKWAGSLKGRCASPRGIVQSIREVNSRCVLSRLLS